MSVIIDDQLVVKNRMYKFCDLQFRCVYASEMGSGRYIKREATFRYDISDKCYLHLIPKFTKPIIDQYETFWETAINYKERNNKFRCVASSSTRGCLNALYVLVVRFYEYKAYYEANFEKPDEETLNNIHIMSDRINSLYAIKDILE